MSIFTTLLPPRLPPRVLGLIVTRGVWEFQLTISLLLLSLVTLLSFTQLVYVYSNISYTFCFVLIIMELSTFPCIYWLFGFPSLVKYVLNLFAHFLFGGFVFSYWVLYIFKIGLLHQLNVFKYYPIVWLVLPFSWWSFWIVIKSTVSIFSTVVTHGNLFPCLHD